MLLAVLGDSLTQGFPFGEQVSWLYVLGEKLGIQTENHGVCGENTSEMKRRLPDILQNEKLTHLLIFGGANDILLDRRRVQNIVADICAMQETAVSYNIKVGCVLPIIPAEKYFVNEFEKLRESIKKNSLNNVLMADFQPALFKEDSYDNFLSDGVHLTIEGNNNIGNYAAIILKSWLEELF